MKIATYITYIEQLAYMIYLDLHNKRKDMLFTYLSLICRHGNRPTDLQFLHY